MKTASCHPADPIRLLSKTRHFSVRWTLGFNRTFTVAVGVLAVLAAGGLHAPHTANAQDLEAQSLDPYAQPVAYTQSSGGQQSNTQRRCLDFLPDGLIYHPYLAGPKESRTGFQYAGNDGHWTFDSSIGGQWGLIRYGTQDPSFPKGVQLDIEASAQFRNRSFGSPRILSSDIRFGLPLSFSRSNHQTKLAIYFMRAHAGDSWLEELDSIRNEEFFQRRSLVLGHSIYLTERWRIYGEAGYAFQSRVSDQWEFQFGTEFAPVRPTGILGEPFLAANGYLREEVNYGGTFTLQAGWAWRKKRGRLCRIGLHYANGMSNQLSLHDRHEQQLGFGIWHDF